MNRRLRLECLAAVSKVFREQGEPISDELLSTIVFALPQELISGNGKTAPAMQFAEQPGNPPDKPKPDQRPGNPPYPQPGNPPNPPKPENPPEPPKPGNPPEKPKPGVPPAQPAYPPNEPYQPAVPPEEPLQAPPPQSPDQSALNY